MNLQQQINVLLDETTQLGQQIVIIEALNQDKFDADVLTTLAWTLRKYSDPIATIADNAIDIVGTGGDGMNTLNFSTLASLVVAAAGYPVAKHGSKSATSRCGSFDLLNKMQVPIPESVLQVEQMFKQHQLVFLFAPFFHPVMKHVVAARKHFAMLGQKTIFNCIGPLINPASVKRMVVGVYDPALLEPYAKTLIELGVEYAYIFHGNGLDELTLTGDTQAIRIENGKYASEEIRPEQLGFTRCKIDDITGGEPEQNFAESMQIINNQLTGPKRDMVVINAAAGICVASEFNKDWGTAVRDADVCLREGVVKQFLKGYCGECDKVEVPDS